MSVAYREVVLAAFEVDVAGVTGCIVVDRSFAVDMISVYCAAPEQMKVYRRCDFVSCCSEYLRAKRKREREKMKNDLFSYYTEHESTRVSLHCP